MDTTALRALRSNAVQVLRRLDRAVLDAAQRVADQAAFSVPRGGAPDDPLNLADTAFVSLPQHNLSARLSTTTTVGYEHPQAGPIHEGFHWGVQTQTPPPQWLRRAAKSGIRPLLVKGVKRELARALSKLFPQK